MLALARLYLTVDDLDSCQQQCVQLLKMDSENDAATVVSTSIDVPYACLFPGSNFCAWQSNRYSNYLKPEIAVSTPLVIQNKTFISSQVQLSTRLFCSTSHGRSCSRSRSRSRSYKRYCCKILIPNRAFLVRLGSI